MRRLGAVLLVLGGAAPAAHAGWYLSPGVRWSSFASRPADDEPTPNYYGYGAALALGYSVKQAFDFGAYGAYLPGTRGEAVFGKEDAALVSYGGELAARMAEAVYFGLRGGVSTYHLYGGAGENELPGEWHGPSGGFSLGAVAKIGKQSFVHTTFDVMHHVVTATDAAAEAADAGKRRFDSFSLTVAYMFNTYDSHLIENTIFKDFLDSILF